MNVKIQATTALSRSQSLRPSRRLVLSLLGSKLGLATLNAELVGAGNRKQRKKLNSGKTISLCLNGQTVTTSRGGKHKSKKLKSLLAQGATRGACAPTLPPGADPPPRCTPVCEAGHCGGNDSCGGTCRCPAGSICHDGACQACTVSCGADGIACGQNLQAALHVGGTIHLCPGRYIGNFQIVAQDAVIIGAGDGSESAQDTILDGNQSDRTLVVGLDRIAELHRLRITGGKTSQDGGGVRSDGRLTMTRCTVIQNEAALDGGGIIHNAAATGPLTLNSCTIERNTGGTGGGLAAHATHLFEMHDSIVAHNTSKTNGGGATILGALKVKGSTIAGNEAVESGGGFHNRGALTINTGTTISGNTATSGGGGLFTQIGACTLNSVKVTGNVSVAAPGGGIFRNSGAVSLFDCVVTENDPDNCAGVTC